MHRKITQQRLEHTCKECKKPFVTLGEPCVVRRGSCIQRRCHTRCFSWTVEPRFQRRSTLNDGKASGRDSSEAPTTREER
ncbi:unnamed protein product [Phaeothamnion confervicola]